MSIKNFDDINGFFMREDLKLTDELFEAAMKDLVADGIMEIRLNPEGVPMYRLTKIGLKVSRDARSDPKVRN